MKFLVGWVLFFPSWLALVMQSFSIASFLLLCCSDIHQQFQCNVVLKLWWESNKSFVLLSKVHPIHASTVSKSRQKWADYTEKSFGLSTFPGSQRSNAAGPHLLHCTRNWEGGTGHLGHRPLCCRTEGPGQEHSACKWCSFHRAGPQRILQQPQFRGSHETAWIVLSKPAVTNSFWKIMGTQRWLKLMFLISPLILCLQPNQVTIQVKRFKWIPQMRKNKNKNPLEYFIWASKTTQGSTEHQS